MQYPIDETSFSDISRCAFSQLKAACASAIAAVWRHGLHVRHHARKGTVVALETGGSRAMEKLGSNRNESLRSEALAYIANVRIYAERFLKYQ